MDKSILIILLTVLYITTGCESKHKTQHPPRGTINYFIENGHPVITTAQTPFDQYVGAKEAYLFWFKRGFEDSVNQDMKLITWKKDHVGDAGLAGYIHGSEEGTLFLHKKK